MYNVEDILAQLQNGQTPDSIAKSFTDSLNAAIQKQKENEAKNADRAKKIAHLTAIFEDIVDFIEEYYPDLILADMDMDINESDVEALIAEFDNIVPILIELNKPLDAAKITIEKPTTNKVSFGDAMEKFFKTNGLI